MHQIKKDSKKIAAKAMTILLAFVLSFSVITSTALMADMPFATVAEAATVFAKNAKVETTDYLNLRKGAGTNYGVITVLSKGTKLTVTAQSSGQWAAVKTSSGTTGYVSTAYIKNVASSSASASSS